jgi:glycosyltransferase involved in cell wall biosynthesis
MKIKIIRSSTVAMSLDILLQGQLAFLNKFFNVIAVSGKDDHLQTIKMRENVRTISVNMQRQIAPLKDVFSLFHLYRVFKKEKPIIVHSITPKAGLLNMIAAYFAGVPIRMHTFTGLIFPSKKGLMKKLLISMDRLLCYFATNIYPEGEGVKKDLINYKITGKPLKVLGNGNINGIDTEYFTQHSIAEIDKISLRSKLMISEADIVFIFIGRIVKDKGINELVKAFHQLNEKFNYIKLLLVGDFEDELDPVSASTKQIINSNLNIVCTGFINDVRPYLAASDVLVFPSYREGFPNVPLQAGCMELPMIVTDVNGCNEIVQDGINGLVIPVKNTAALQSAMERMTKDEVFRKECASASRQIIVENYSRETIWNALLKEYETLLHKKGINFTHVPEIPETIV